MKITNKYGLPEPLVSAVQLQDTLYKEGYDRPADISVTTLLKPPQMVMLERNHADDLEEDASDRIWALMGQIIHGVLESHADASDDLIEHRMYADVAGWTISGQLDRYDAATATLQDYKMTSVWEHVNGIKPEREAQLNILAWMLEQEGRKVDRIQIVAIYRDWSVSKARNGGSYPQSQVAVHDVNLWTAEEQRVYIENRVAEHQNAEGARCSSEDRWAKPTVWAVMKDGRKSAVKLHDSADQAQDHAANLGGKHYVVERPGEDTRCENYCSVAQWCPQRNSGD